MYRHRGKLCARTRGGDCGFGRRTRRDHRNRGPRGVSQATRRELRGTPHPASRAAVQAARCGEFSRRLGARRAARPAASAGRRRRHRVSAVHRRHHRHRQGGDVDPSQHGGQFDANGGPLERYSRAGTRRDDYPAAPVPRVLSHLRLPPVHAAGRTQCAHYRPARYTGIRSRASQMADDDDHRRRHPVQGVVESPRIRTAGFFTIEARRGRRNAPTAHDRGELARSHGTAARRRIWSYRSVAGCCGQPGKGSAGRHGGFAAAVDGNQHPGRIN